MNDEGAAIRRLAREEPCVAVRTPVQFSSVWHLSRPFREHSRLIGDARARAARRDGGCGARDVCASGAAASPRSSSSARARSPLEGDKVRSTVHNLAS